MYEEISAIENHPLYSKYLKRRKEYIERAYGNKQNNYLVKDVVKQIQEVINKCNIRIMKNHNDIEARIIKHIHVKEKNDLEFNARKLERRNDSFVYNHRDGALNIKKQENDNYYSNDNLEHKDLWDFYNLYSGLETLKEKYIIKINYINKKINRSSKLDELQKELEDNTNQLNFINEHVDKFYKSFDKLINNYKLERTSKSIFNYVKDYRNNYFKHIEMLENYIYARDTNTYVRCVHTKISAATKKEERMHDKIKEMNSIIEKLNKPFKNRDKQEVNEENAQHLKHFVEDKDDDKIIVVQPESINQDEPTLSV